MVKAENKLKEAGIEMTDFISFSTHGAIIKLVNNALNEKDELLEALNSLLNPDLERYSQTTGCPMCDNGVLRNPQKEHWDNCNWNNARIIYERAIAKKV